MGPPLLLVRPVRPQPPALPGIPARFAPPTVRLPFCFALSALARRRRPDRGVRRCARAPPLPRVPTDCRARPRPTAIVRTAEGWASPSPRRRELAPWVLPPGSGARAHVLGRRSLLHRPAPLVRHAIMPALAYYTTQHLRTPVCATPLPPPVSSGVTVTRQVQDLSLLAPLTRIEQSQFGCI